MASYVPVLSDKRAEMHALAELPNGLAARTYPLVTVRQPEPPENPRRRWTPEAALADRAVSAGDGLVGCWGSARRVIVDLTRISLDQFESTDGRVIDDFFDLCATVGIVAVPAIGREAPRPARDAITRSIRRMSNGACIRLRGEDVASGVAGMNPLLRELDLPREMIDVVIDLEEITSNAFLIARLAAEFLTEIHPESGWRTVALTASSFPSALHELVDYNSHEVISRTEQDVWRRATRVSEKLASVQFGDYGIVSASPQAGFRGAANIRYTLRDGWLVLRGHHRDKAPPGDYANLARDLRQMEGWMGRDHCPGCKFIDDHANGGKPGNPTQWRQAGFSHHFATVMAA